VKSSFQQSSPPQERRYNPAMSRFFRLLLIIVAVSLSAEAATKTYLTGKVVKINSERTASAALFILYIEHDKKTFSVRLRETPTYKLDWAVDDPIEFRLTKDAIFLKRPNGKDMRLALLDSPTMDGHLSDAGDLPFPKQAFEIGIDVARVPAEHRPRRCAEIAAGETQFEPLENACLYALSSSALNFVCQETNERATRGLLKGEWKDVDVVTGEVAVVNGQVERFSNVAINGHTLKLPPNTDRGQALAKRLSDMNTGGLWSVVEFETVLATIFSRASQTNFRYVGDVELPSGSANLFKFELDAASNVSYVLAVSDLRYTPGLAGSLWTDRKTGQLVRVETSATQLDWNFPIVADYHAINYGDVPISDLGTFLLPTAAETVVCQYPLESHGGDETIVRTEGRCYKNTISFHDCHKFVVESHISPDASK
jgi:hypothetical protein